MALLAVSLIDRVAEILTRYNMLPVGSKIGVGVSGGADSVALLHLLHRLRSQFKIELAALHLNHQLRGEESEADERFVRELAHSLGVPVYCESAVLPPGNVEEEARSARRSFFVRVREREGLARIALGHSRSDQAETVLFRFLRGSGTAGLAGMRPVTAEGFMRPLLELSRHEIRAWASAEGLAWREDSSNNDPRFTRNRIRIETLPELQERYNPNLEAVLANMATVSAAEEEFWTSEVTALAENVARPHPLGIQADVDAMGRLHPALRRRLIRHLLREVKGDLRSIDVLHVEAMLGLLTSLQGHDRVLVPGVDALRSFGTLLLTRPGTLNAEDRQYRLPLEAGAWCELPGRSGAIRLKHVNTAVQFCDNVKSEEDFPFEAAEVNRGVLSDAGLIRPLYVRNWEPGDQIHRPGHSRPEKLKALFGEYRVLLWDRRHWPVVVCDDEIVWTRRFGCSAKYKACAPSDAVCRLEFREPGSRRNFDPPN
jgi:tRNA(Ile)-lysidine synthase